MAECGRAVTDQFVTTGDQNLQFDEVDSGGDLGDRVLDLQTGVDLEEREELVLGLVEVFDRACALVSGCLDQFGGHLLEVVRLFFGQDGGGGFFDDLLVATLNRAVANARSPDIAVVVGDDLYLDVACIGDKAFEEDDGVAEGPLCFALRALECNFEFVFGPDLADTASAAAASGLDDQGISDGLSMTTSVGARFDRSAAPRGDRYADLLGQDLGGNLVAEQAHRVGARADERDAQFRDDLREGGILGHEAPADPDCVGLGREQCSLEFGVVEIRATGAGAAQGHALIGLADEHGAALGLGVQCNDANAVVVFGVQFAYSPDQPDRGLTSIDHCDSFEHCHCHRP